jgi:hypothetical protein
MKQALFLLATIMVLASCAKSEKHKVYRNGTVVEVDGPIPTPKPAQHKRIPPADGKYPAVTFAETTFDFGDIAQGDKVSHEFKFENTGAADLVISDAYGSCGCTVPEFPKEAIKPGETGKIKVTFNSAGKHGRQQKKVTLVTNTQAEKEYLQIKVNINPGT